MPRPPLDDAPTRDIGPYRLAHRIAVSAMAEVYRALWPQTAGGDRAVVIKRLLPELAEDPTRRAMFEEEVRLGARIAHPNVVAVLDHGVDEGSPYLVLEYVFGVDLWRLTRWLGASGRALHATTAAWIATELLAGLEAVHALADDAGAALNVVHRDVSPSNVFLSVHGDVKLGDLGIARPTRPAGPEGARAKGKLGYLAPEQIDGRSLDARADVFSAAVVLAELLAGRPLFAGATEIAILLAIRDGDVSVFREVAPRLPAGLADVVLRALERRPEQRTASASALRGELLPFVRGHEAACRAELGALVVGALDAATSTAEHHALKKTVEQAAFGRDTRPESEPTRYAVEREGESLGDFGLAELVRAVTVGEVLPTDRLRESDGEPRRVETIPEIAGFIPSSRRTPTARRLVELRETAERWELGTRTMVGILGELLRARETGLLLCERGAIRKEVYVVDGVPAFVTSNQPSELFGEALVEAGVLARFELDLALAALPRYRGRLGEALVGMGLLDPVELVHHLGEHGRRRLLSLFEWSEGSAALYRELERPPRAFRIELDPWAMLEEGAARWLALHGEPRFATHALAAAGEAPRDLPAALLALRARFDAPRGPAQIAASGPLARIALLIELGALEWREPRGEA